MARRSAQGTLHVPDGYWQAVWFANRQRAHEPDGLSGGIWARDQGSFECSLVLRDFAARQLYAGSVLELAA